MANFGSLRRGDGQKNLQVMITMRCCCMGEGFPVRALILARTQLRVGVGTSNSSLRKHQTMLKNKNIMKNYLFYRFHMADFRFRPYVLKYHVLKKKSTLLILARTPNRARNCSDASQTDFCGGFGLCLFRGGWFWSMPLSVGFPRSIIITH